MPYKCRHWWLKVQANQGVPQGRQPSGGASINTAHFSAISDGPLEIMNIADAAI